jgi:hypothetical protein
MHSLGDLAKPLNREPLYLRGLLSRFEVPLLEGAHYTAAHLAFLETIIRLRTFNIPEDTLRDLWHLEKKLLQLLHVDSTGSTTWFLDACGETGHPERRLLLSNHDLGVSLPSGVVQLGLNFSKSLPELFAGKEMGEDTLRVLAEYLKQHQRILSNIAAELPRVRAAVKWAARFKPRKQPPTALN